MIRAESGLPLRTHYGIVRTPDGIEPQKAGRLIDSKGNSIYFRSGGKQRNLNEGMNIMLRVNGGEIIHSRMKIGGKEIGFPYNYNSQNPKTVQ